MHSVQPAAKEADAVAAAEAASCGVARPVTVDRTHLRTVLESASSFTLGSRPAVNLVPLAAGRRRTSLAATMDPGTQVDLDRGSLAIWELEKKEGEGERKSDVVRERKKEEARR